VESEKTVRLVWEADALSLAQIGTDYYYCVFRKGPGDKKFKYMYNVSSDTLEYTDPTLRKGEEAEYYVSIRFTDGRESRESNVVKVKR